MQDPLQLAEAVRQACLSAAIEAYQQAGISGLCHEGRWDLALQEIRSLDLQSLVEKLQETEMESPRSGTPTTKY